MPQYQGVWTLEQQAQAQSNQQWVTDPNFKNTTLLLQADGTGSGSQNNTFLDGSTNNFFITRNGNTTQGSFSPFSQAPGYWSNYFADGSSSYLTLSSGPTFGSGDYTLEFFAYKTTSWTDGFDFLDAATSGLALYVSSGTMAVTKQNVGGTAVVLGSLTSLSPNAWHHFAIVRSSGSVRCYVNGSPLQAAVSDANNYTVATTKICGTSDGYFDGYISNMRLATSALYSIAGSSITVPTAPLATATGVQYLGSQSNRFVDTTGTQTVAVGGGTPSVQAFGPFAPALQWTPTVVGGSGYFDGSGDYLGTGLATGLDNISGDFTIEYWQYPLTGGSALSPVLGSANSSFSGTASFFGYEEGANKLNMFLNATQASSLISYTAPTKLTNNWSHIAWVRSGSVITLYLNGTSVATVTYTSTINLNTTNSNTYIGRNGWDAYYWLGYIAGLRVIKGTAVVPSTGGPTTPPTAVTNTQLLLNYTNAGIYDGKMANNLETVGNAQVATSPVKYGSGSMYFDGTGDWLLAPSTPNVGLGTGNFTFETWAYPTSNPTNGPGTIMDARNSATSEGWVVRIFPDLSVGFYDGPANTYQQTAAAVVPLNTWTHIACVRAGTILTIFINGVALKTATVSSNLGTAWPFYIGNNYTAGYTYYGYLDDYRITKGVARYYANFTPPQQALPRQ